MPTASTEGSRRRAATQRVTAQLKEFEPEERESLRRFAHSLSQRGMAHFKEKMERPIVDTNHVSKGRMLWVTHWMLMVLAVIAVFACSVYLSFILVPLVVAYFVTFLLDPIIQLLTKRPLVFCGHELCRNNMLKANRHRYERSREGCCASTVGAVQQFCLDLFLLGRLPHSFAVLLTLSFALFSVYMLTTFIISSINAAWTAVATHLATLEGKDPATATITVSEGAAALYDAVQTWAERTLHALQRNTGLRLRFSLNDLTRGLFSSGSGWSTQALTYAADIAYNVGYYVATVLLLAAYIMVGRPSGGRTRRLHLTSATTGTTGSSSTIGSQAGPQTAELVELTLKRYTSCKALSGAVLGTLVALIYHLCGVQLAFLWGLLTFLLEFVPYLGPLFALLLPLPFIIFAQIMRVDPAQAAAAAATAAAASGAAGGGSASGNTIPTGPGSGGDEGGALDLTTVALLAPLTLHLCNAALEPFFFRLAAPALCLDRVCVLVAVAICWQAWSVVGAAVAVPLLATSRIVLDGIDHPVAPLVSAILRPRFHNRYAGTDSGSIGGGVGALGGLGSAFAMLATGSPPSRPVLSRQNSITRPFAKERNSITRTRGISRYSNDASSSPISEEGGVVAGHTSPRSSSSSEDEARGAAKGQRL